MKSRNIIKSFVLIGLAIITLTSISNAQNPEAPYGYNDTGWDPDNLPPTLTFTSYPMSTTSGTVNGVWNLDAPGPQSGWGQYSKEENGVMYSMLARTSMAGTRNYSYYVWTTDNPAFWWSEGTMNGTDDWYQVYDSAEAEPYAYVDGLSGWSVSWDGRSLEAAAAAATAGLIFEEGVWIPPSN
jgi:hypothetical protein